MNHQENGLPQNLKAHKFISPQNKNHKKRRPPNLQDDLIEWLVLKKASPATFVLMCLKKLTKVATSYKKLANMLQKLLIYALLHEKWTYAKFEKSINFVDSSTTYWILEVVGTKLITDYLSSEKSPQNQWYQQNIVNILRKSWNFVKIFCSECMWARRWRFSKKSMIFF